jgi:hypothetical protein
VPLAATGYRSLPGNCWKNETLPSLAFGQKESPGPLAHKLTDAS